MTTKSTPRFPLWEHPSGRWCKKIRDRFFYFGSVADDPEGEAALKLWTDQADDLRKGRTPGRSPEQAADDKQAVTVGHVTNDFLEAKQKRVDSGELSPRSWRDYKDMTERLGLVLGWKTPVSTLGPDDFRRLRAQIAKTRGLVALGNEVTRVKTIFTWAFKSGLIEMPLFGPDFERPDKKDLRKERNGRGSRLIDAADLRKLIEAADVHLKAMVYLGLNCGYGPTDCGRLPLDAVDLDQGWIRFPRPKTGIVRRCPLWVETVEALKASLAKRRTPKLPAAKELFFVTKRGLSWSKDTPDGPIGKEFRKLLDEVKLYRRGRSFYSLRHIHRTRADGAGDRAAADHLMGHSDGHMREVYSHVFDGEELSDEAADRLRRVVNYVRDWLQAKPGKKQKGKGAPALRVVG